MSNNQFLFVDRVADISAVAQFVDVKSQIGKAIKSVMTFYITGERFVADDFKLLDSYGIRFANSFKDGFAPKVRSKWTKRAVALENMIDGLRFMRKFGKIDGNVGHVQSLRDDLTAFLKLGLVLQERKGLSEDYEFLSQVWEHSKAVMEANWLEVYGEAQEMIHWDSAQRMYGDEGQYDVLSNIRHAFELSLETDRVPFSRQYQLGRGVQETIKLLGHQFFTEVGTGPGKQTPAEHYRQTWFPRIRNTAVEAYDIKFPGVVRYFLGLLEEYEQSFCVVDDKVVVPIAEQDPTSGVHEQM